MIMERGYTAPWEFRVWQLGIVLRKYLEILWMG
jgi:hypothetical protein